MESGDWCLHSGAKSCGVLGVVLEDVPCEICSPGGEGEVSLGVFGFEADDQVGDGDHQDVH